MKKLSFILILLILTSCVTTKDSGILPEDQLFLTRKYVGNFIEYRYTPAARFGDPQIVWIKTTQDTTYGKISVYSRECEFKTGEQLYLRRVYVSPGMWGYWEYQLENNYEIIYKVSEFQYDGKVLVQNWF